MRGEWEEWPTPTPAHARDMDDRRRRVAKAARKKTLQKQNIIVVSERCRSSVASAGRAAHPRVLAAYGVYSGMTLSAGEQALLSNGVSPDRL